MNQKNMNPEETEFANRLRTLIKLLNFTTIAAFADAIGVSSAIIQKYLGKNGHYAEPNFKTLKKIKNKFSDVNFNWLATGNGFPLSPDVIDDVDMEGLTAGECIEHLRDMRKKNATLTAALDEKDLLISLLRQKIGA